MPRPQRARIGTCPICGNEFRATKDYSTDKGQRLQKYCSKDCWSKRATIHGQCQTCGKAIKSYASWVRKFCSLECRNKDYTKRTREQSPAWRGDDATYSAIHKHINVTYGKADKCEQCASTRFVDWANISGDYKRTRDDWMQLCRKCHFYYDKRYETLKRY